MLFTRVLRHTFVMSALAIALCAIFMAFSGQLSGPNARIAIDSHGAVAAAAPADHVSAPLAMARRIIPINDAPAARP